MSPSINTFVNSLVTLSPGLGETWRESVDYWKPEVPPITVLLAELGCRIADDYGKIEIEKNRQIFSLIEDAMIGDDRDLETVVATGLIEALASRTARIEGLWSRMSPIMGKSSREHAEWWLSDC